MSTERTLLNTAATGLRGSAAERLEGMKVVFRKVVLEKYRY
jgi:hypothetical protein